jgi:hypothetical protein
MAKSPIEIGEEECRSKARWHRRYACNHQPHDERTRGILRERGLIRTKTSDTGAPLDAAFLGAARTSSNARNRRIRPLPARALDTPCPFPPQKPRVRGLLASRNPEAESPLPGIVTEDVVPTLRICRELGIKLNTPLPVHATAAHTCRPIVTTAEGHQVLEVGEPPPAIHPPSSSAGYLWKKEGGEGDGPGKPSAEGERERERGWGSRSGGNLDPKLVNRRCRDAATVRG